MFEQVNYPVSKARAAYWAGRAAEKASDKDASQSWYNTASAYPTTFYGQLAAAKQNGTAPLRIPAPPNVSGDDQRRFEQSSLTKAIKLCLEIDENDTASRLINFVAENSDNAAQSRLTAELGKETGSAYLSVRAAKKALQKNIVLLEAGYPNPKTPPGIAIERPLALAIMRQESEYDARARSPAGAMGLMQLMPRTAKEVAKKEGISFSADRLYESQYNMSLGTAYLSRMVDSYDGSYVMAIAAYNAGPGNVRLWAKQFGTPGNKLDNAVNWIEKIPYSETRNYVQRVMENLQVYRHIEAGKNTPKLQIAEDLMR
jgi:soluble lytic murein transglycosylase